MPHESRAANYDNSFIAALMHAWTKAGPPSYAEFEKVSRKVLGPAQQLSASTTQSKLAGHRRSVPSWPWVFKFWKVLREVAVQNGIDPDSLGTLEEWKTKHEAASIMGTAGCMAVGGELAQGGPSRGQRELRGATPRQLLGPVSDDPRQELAALRQAIGSDWWAEYHEVVPAWFGTYLSLEPAASLIHTYDATFLPGLLQTEAYALAAIRDHPRRMPQRMIRQLVELRMRRQELVFAQGAARLWAIVDEDVLRRPLGDGAVMRAQLERLLELVEHPEITLQVAPRSSTVRVNGGDPLVLLRFPRSDLPDVLYLEQLTSAVYLLQPEEIIPYRSILGQLVVQARKPAATSSLLRQLLTV